jgi:uncharacterized protein involved in cysteine biosynthesis
LIYKNSKQEKRFLADLSKIQMAFCTECFYFGAVCVVLNRTQLFKKIGDFVKNCVIGLVIFIALATGCYVIANHANDFMGTLPPDLVDFIELLSSLLEIISWVFKLVKFLAKFLAKI